MPAKAGDAIFFSYLTVHASGVNTSDEARTTWLVQFRDPADPPLTDAHSFSLGQGMMLAGVDPTARGHAGKRRRWRGQRWAAARHGRRHHGRRLTCRPSWRQALPGCGTCAPRG